MRTKKSADDITIVIVDFKHDVAVELGQHYEHYKRDEYTVPCPICGSKIRQSWDECYCGAHVVWENSEAWKSAYGSPKDKLRMLQQYAAETETGRRLLRFAGKWVQGFRTKTDRDRWQRALNQASPEIIEKCFRAIAHDNYGYGRVKHAINYLSSVVEGRPSHKPRPEQPKSKKKKQSGGTRF